MLHSITCRQIFCRNCSRYGHEKGFAGGGISIQQVFVTYVVEERTKLFTGRDFIFYCSSFAPATVQLVLEIVCTIYLTSALSFVISCRSQQGVSTASPRTRGRTGEVSSTHLKDCGSECRVSFSYRLLMAF